jgi:hypothetical protein
MKDYIVRASLHEETNSGWIWVDGIPSRTIVRIKDRKTQRTVFCEAREFDTNFLEKYNRGPRIEIPVSNRKPTIVISKWYRDALGIEETTSEDNSTGKRTLDIQPARIWWWRALRAASHHPDIFVRLSTRLGILGAWLGVVGVAPNVSQFINGTQNSVMTFAVPITLAIMGFIACREPNHHG